MRPYAAKITRIPVTGGNESQMRETIRLMGRAIRRASVYPPIRNHAAAVATTAPPKDFLGQLQAIYRDFTDRWRYVKDPVSRELLTYSPQAIWNLTMAGDGVGVGRGRGAGDCDCAAMALGAQLEAIGFRTRLGTTVKAPPGRLFGHVFLQAKVPNFGWVTIDPVLYPKKHFGAVAKHTRIAWWDLDGNLLGVRGNYTGLSGLEKEADDMQTPNIEQWPDYGLGAVTPDDGMEPIDWSSVGLKNWGYVPGPDGQRYSAVASYGYIDGAQLNGMAVEVDENDDWGDGNVRTPMLELAVDDYQYVVNNGQPYDGMLALGDTGEVYYYDGLGFFKKLFKKIKRKVKKVARRVKRGIKKVLKKSRFGRFLLKIGGKIKRIAMRVVRPLMKFVGKWAGKLAPIAALIPGYGTAIAGALAAAGKVAKLMTKFGVRTKGKKGKVRGLKLKNPRKLPRFQRALKKEAKRMQKFKRRDPRKFKRLATKLARRR